MDGPVYPTDMNKAKEFRKKAKKFGIDLLLIKQKHIGSDCLPGYIDDMFGHLKSKQVEIHTSEDVRDILVSEEREITGVITNRKTYKAKNVILAPGRVGANWLKKLAQNHKIDLNFLIYLLLQFRLILKLYQNIIRNTQSQK